MSDHKYTNKELAKIIIDLAEVIDGLMPGIKYIAFDKFELLNESLIEAGKVERSFLNANTAEEVEQVDNIFCKECGELVGVGVLMGGDVCPECGGDGINPMGKKHCPGCGMLNPNWLFHTRGGNQ